MLSSAFFNAYFLLNPLILRPDGILEVNSSISGFKYGARTSRFAAMDVRSVVSRFSAGRNVLKSTYKRRFSGDHSRAFAKYLQGAIDVFNNAYEGGQSPNVAYGEVTKFIASIPDAEIQEIFFD